MKEASIYQHLEYNDKKPVITVLMETEFSKEVRIAMHAGTIMKEHKTKFPIIVEIVSGNIDFGVNGETKELKKGNLIALDSNVPHDLRANEDSIIRLTLSKNDNVQRAQNVADS